MNNMVFDMGVERYESQEHNGWQELRNAQLYPRDFVAGYDHAAELHQDRYVERCYEEGRTW